MSWFCLSATSQAVYICAHNNDRHLQTVCVPSQKLISVEGKQEKQRWVLIPKEQACTHFQRFGLAQADQRTLLVKLFLWRH